MIAILFFSFLIKAQSTPDYEQHLKEQVALLEGECAGDKLRVEFNKAVLDERKKILEQIKKEVMDPKQKSALRLQFELAVRDQRKEFEKKYHAYNSRCKKTVTHTKPAPSHELEEFKSFPKGGGIVLQPGK